MTEIARPFVPAAGQHWLLPLYDPLARWLGADRARSALVEQAALAPGHRALDVGCGTGTLLHLVRTLHPQVEIAGLDPDEAALDRARQKLQRAGLQARLDRGYSDALPYPDRSFERVFSSFMLHHLPPAEKSATLREIRRVLAPGGSLHLVDFGGSGSHAHGLLARLVRSRPRLHEQLGDGVITLLREAGFEEVREVRRQGSLGGPLGWYRAVAP